MHKRREIIRRVRFAPYSKGNGPRFILQLWDGNSTDSAGRFCVGYQLTMYPGGGKMPVRLFRGEDFHCHHAIDSDGAVEGIMSFLTLRPGDTDAEYFAGYDADQLAYCAAHAETLNMEVMVRFGQEG